MESRVTMNISLPEPMREWVEDVVRSDNFGTVSEYVRSLIRDDQKKRSLNRLEKRLLDALDSGPAAPLTKADWDKLRDDLIARTKARQGKRAG